MYEKAIQFSRKATTTGGVMAVGADVAHAVPQIAEAAPSVGAYSLTELLGIVGATVAVLGFLFGQFWSWRKDRREAEESRARLRRMARESGRVPLEPCANDEDDKERRA